MPNNKIPNNKKQPKKDKIDIASDDSFPCSDPSGWTSGIISVHAAPVGNSDDEIEDLKDDDLKDKGQQKKTDQG